MRPAGFEPPTRGLEVRRFVYKTPVQHVISQIWQPSSTICHPRISARCCLTGHHSTVWLRPCSFRPSPDMSFLRAAVLPPAYKGALTELVSSKVLGDLCNRSGGRG